MPDFVRARGIVPLAPGAAWVLIDKPAGITSRRAVDHVRRVTGVRKAGHAGTLDPIATGLLVVGVGREATKRLSEGLAGNKTYEATVRFGICSPTHDTDADRLVEVEVPEFGERRLRDAFAAVTSRPEQTPPLVSALKLRGQPLYRVARRGWWLPREPRRAEIEAAELMAYDAAARECKFAVTVAGGFYVRGLVRDIGTELGAPAALSALRRTQAGEYTIDAAVPLAELENTWRACSG
ncbi:MAG: tRNA pseudouridine synthase B [Calditrichaeota bacterium]|nr:tRNA pseudouridine synthase B [Calditrichota bacterium]